MLRRLTIENYALIDALDIEFGAGLNTVTGETGAGKSLLLGALSLLLGGKAEANVLRDKEKPCVVEGEFRMSGFGLETLFERLDLDYADPAILRRVVGPQGKSRAFVNDLPVALSVLREIGDRLVDIHSQHQTLLLGRPEFRLELTDSVAGSAELLSKYSDIYDRWRRSIQELEKLRRTDAENRRDEDYLRFQWQQLDQARLRPGEQAELEAEQTELTHAAEIREGFYQADELFSADESGVLIQLKTAESQLNKISSFSSRAGVLAGRIRAAAEELKDAAAELSAERERIDVDPRRLETVESRLDTLYTLQQKHRSTGVEDLIELRDEMAKKLSGIDCADEEIARLQAQTERLHTEALELAARLSAARKKAAPAIEKQVVGICSRLGMPNVRFQVDVVPEELSATGADRVVFLFTANKNAAPQPVEKIASGGEMSRLMLSLKSLTAQHKQLPTIIFDEIDTGVSGEIADRMGQIIADLSGRLQVINITHLPQIAGKGVNHYKVYKEESAAATNTRIRRLTPDERVEEIARMLSGARVTEAAVRQAKTLLE